VGSGFRGIHSARFSLKGCIPSAMKTALGAHEEFRLDGGSTESVETRRNHRSEMPLFPPKPWSRNVRQAVVFVAKQRETRQ